MRVALAISTSAVLVLASAGCSRMVDGRAMVAEPKIGQPVQWVRARRRAASTRCRCRRAGSAARSRCRSTIPSRMARRLSRDDPLPRQRPEDRFAADQSGRAGESGIEAAASIYGEMPTTVRQHFDVVGFDPRGVGASTPALWCNSDADNDRMRADPQVDYSPRGIEHIEGETKAFIQRCVDKMGNDFRPMSERRTSSGTWMRCGLPSETKS